MKLLAQLKTLKSVKLTKKQIAWIAVLLAVLIALIVLFLIGKNRGWFALFESKEQLREYVSSFGVWAPLAFFVLQFVQVIISPIPGGVTSFVGGLLFGFFYGSLLSFSAMALGSVCAFLLGRLFGRPLVERIASKQTVDKYFTTVTLRQRVLLILMFLFPFFPDDILCLIAGLSPMKLRSFTLIVLLTRPWGVLVASLIGANAIALPSWSWIAIGVVIVLVFILAMKYAPQIEERVRVWMEKKFKKVS